jgi:hypothetical protein
MISSCPHAQLRDGCLARPVGQQSFEQFAFARVEITLADRRNG